MEGATVLRAMRLPTTKWDVIWPASKLICLDKHDEQNI